MSKTGDVFSAMRHLLRIPPRALLLRGSQISAIRPSAPAHVKRTFHASLPRTQERSDPAAHRNFYRTHGRAIFKALTLAFFTYQVVYYAWLVVETEEVKAEKRSEIESLESEVRLLDEQRRGQDSVGGAERKPGVDGPRLLEKKQGGD